MTLLYIGNYSQLDGPLGYCPNAWWIEETFRQLGWEVDGVDEASYEGKDILQMLVGKKYDLVLCEEGRLKDDHHSDDEGNTEIKGYFQPIVDYCKEHNIPIVSWLTNVFFGVMQRHVQVYTNPIFKSDIVFSTDGGHQKEFEEAGVNHKLLRQGIYKPESYISKEKFPTSAELVFIGSVYEHIWPYRKKLIDFLKDTYGSRFEHLGQKGEIRHEPLNNLMATVKIVVGDSVYSPYYWSNRVYEVIGRGGFLIHPRVPGLDKEFTPYKHFIPYDLGNFEQLREIIDYYLEHDEEREKIRMAGFEYCRKHHTYQNRVKEMIKEIDGLLKQRNS